MLRRYLVVLVLALWMGGFTFYTLFVIPTASKVLGSDREQGFITQQVTNQLNYIGVAALLMLGLLQFTECAEKKSLLLWAAWVAMAALQVALFFIHPVIDQMLDTATHKIRGLDHFYPWHRVYMVVASLQWLFALAYLWLSLRRWRKNDCSMITRVSQTS